MSEADRIREFILDKYITPAREEGKPSVDVRAGDVFDIMYKNGELPIGGVPNVCQTLKGPRIREFAEAIASVVVNDSPSEVGQDLEVRFYLTIKAAMAKAEQFYNAKNFERTITFLDQVLENFSKNADAWYLRGYAKNEIGEYLEAIKDLDEAIKLNPNHSYAWASRGYAKNEIGEYLEAIKDLDEAIKLNPNHSYAWASRGYAKNEIGEYLEAIKDLDEAIKLKPNHSYAWASRGYAKNEIGEYLEAIKDLDEAIKLNPNHSYAWASRGYAKNEIGEYLEAIADLRQSLKLDPNNDNTLRILQSILQEIEVEKLAKKNTTEYDEKVESIRKTACNYKTTYNNLYVVIAFLLFTLGVFIFVILKFFYIDLTNNACNIECFVTKLEIKNVVPLVSITLALTLPLVWLIRMLTRIADDMRIMSEDYMRIHTIESRILLFFKGDKQKQTKLHEIFINHMMTNSPVETLLKLRKHHRSKDIRHPAENVMDKGSEILGKTQKPS